MNFNTQFLFSYWLIFGLLIVIGRLILWLVVYPKLRKHNIEYKVGGFGDYKATDDYKRACSAESEPLTFWYLLLFIHWALPILLVGWVLLILSHV